MLHYPKLVIVEDPAIAVPENDGRFIRLSSVRETVTEGYFTISSVKLFDKISGIVTEPHFVATRLDEVELVNVMQNLKWPFAYIFMTQESADDLVHLLMAPKVPIDTSEFARTEPTFGPMVIMSE
jgi:hypothetical protein